MTENPSVSLQQLLGLKQNQEDGHKILCCLCGIAIPPNPANMCLNCIRGQVDITEGLSKEEIISFCRGCERYLQPPKYWVKCDLESRELLQVCLKKIKGLNKVKLIDASWIWTEPHSRRLKVKMTIQKEVFNGTILQQSFVVEYIVKNLQCESCQRSYTENTWKAIVQVRQKVDHKRTFYFLEQLILKHDMHEKCLNIKERTDGVDFYFDHRSHAQKFVNFIGNFCPIKIGTSKRLITHDEQNSVYNYKYAFSIEIAPICREDLICLPAHFAKSMGGIGPVVLCHKINSNVHFVDPHTLKFGEIMGTLYWKHSFKSMMNSRQLIEYTVLDVEATNVAYGKYRLVEVQVAKTEDIGNVISIKSHLGHLLKPGDTVLGYDVKNSNFNDDNADGVDMSQAPDVMLVRKVFSKRKDRKWTLKRMAPEGPAPAKLNKTEKSKNQDYERFLEELEEDPEYRANINIFKAKEEAAPAPAESAATEASASASATAPAEATATATTKAAEKKPEKKKAKPAESDTEDEEVPGISEEELKELVETKLNISKAPEKEFNDEDFDELDGDWEDMDDEEESAPKPKSKAPAKTATKQASGSKQAASSSTKSKKSNKKK